jgi:hypothetical protein
MKSKLIQVVNHIDNNTELKIFIEIIETVLSIAILGIGITLISSMLTLF